MTTTSISLPGKFHTDTLADGWYAFINSGEYTSEQQDALVKALLEAQVEAANRMLPDGHVWHHMVDELVYPVGDDNELDMCEILADATQEVIDSFEAIEARVI
ncbi:hypothetical protein LHJ74_30900 [Streptomyces sp. N2-109]|uniref:Uncharacterized protein n=1 Tax=Streptomyces gossypii TaxID=2883101 RepID=A0ABT2K2Q9_9ACTN|nr:hypothetical protein [Streptomyces gossypii]MCT2594266.1 hypothetical protein [Streptomyces gossypii]